MLLAGLQPRPLIRSLIPNDWSLAPKLLPFGIRSVLFEPGFLRTELLSPESTRYAESTIDDYVDKDRETRHRLAWHARRPGRRPRQASLTPSCTSPLWTSHLWLPSGSRRRRHLCGSGQGSAGPCPCRAVHRSCHQQVCHAKKRMSGEGECGRCGDALISPPGHHR